ncbi:MAG: T9SS type A sorting domain-containing protein [Cytophagales bacterium]|nr:T9SS type A sorting domain-containing protein [Cytophagales bacterium]
MGKTILFYVFSTFTVLQVNAQSVLNATGRTVSNSNFEIDYAVGDWVDTQIQSYGYEVKSGVIQRAYLLNVVNSQNVDYSPVMTVFPNPTSGTLRISELPKGTFRIELFDNQGLELKRFAPCLDLSFPEIPSGTYHLHFRDSKNEILSTIKIIKS